MFKIDLKTGLSKIKHIYLLVTPMSWMSFPSSNLRSTLWTSLSPSAYSCDRAAIVKCGCDRVWMIFFSSCTNGSVLYQWATYMKLLQARSKAFQYLSPSSLVLHSLEFSAQTSHYGSMCVVVEGLFSYLIWIKCSIPACKLTNCEQLRSL